jgi:hypothetical protein
MSNAFLFVKEHFQWNLEMMWMGQAVRELKNETEMLGEEGKTSCHQRQVHES